MVYEFKKLVEGLEEKGKFLYVQGPDFYFTKNDDENINDCSLLRYRKAEGEKRSEVTMKKKPEGAKHNIKRKEVNWRVDGTKYETIHEGLTQSFYGNHEISLFLKEMEKNVVNNKISPFTAAGLLLEKYSSLKK